MRLTTADRQALRVHLTSEFHRWVEELLSRDELPLVGSAVPATTQPPPRRGKCKTKTKAKKKTTTKTTTPRKSTAPAASSPEDAAPEDWKTARKGKRRRSLDTSHTPQPGKRPRALTTPPASMTKQCHNCEGFGHATRTCKNMPVCAQCSGSHRSYVCIEKRIEGIPPKYYCDLCEEDGHGLRSRFCRNRPQPQKPKRSPAAPQEDAMDTTPPAPTNSVVATQTPAPAPPRHQRQPPAASGHSATSHRLAK